MIRRRPLKVDSQSNSRIRSGRLDCLLLILALSMLTYALLFSWISYSQFRSFESRVPQDMAAHNQAIWNTSQGRFLQQTVLYVGGLNHFYPILFLFAPVYRLTDHIFPLFLFYSLILASGAIAVYLTARDQLGARHWGVLMGIFYLIYPGLHYFNLYDLKPSVLSLPLLLFSFYFWQARRLPGFLIFLVLTSTTTEHVAPLIMMFGLLSWVRKRDLRWVLLPLLIGLVVLLISMYVYVPWASGARYKHIRSHQLFSSLNLLAWSSYKEVLSFMGLAVLFLFLSWEAFILAMPYVLFGGFAVLIHPRYYFPLVGILFISLIYGLVRMTRWKALKGRSSFPRMAMPIAACLLLAFVICDPFLIRVQYRYSMSPSDYEAWSLIEEIPKGASVTSDPILMPALSRRQRLHEFSRKEYHGPKIDYLDVDYVLIDPQGPHRITYFQKDFKGKARSFLEETLRDRSGFEIAATKGEWVLFRRKSKPLLPGGGLAPPSNQAAHSWARDRERLTPCVAWGWFRLRA